MNKNQNKDKVSEKFMEDTIKVIRDVFDRDIFNYGGEITFESLSEKKKKKKTKQWFWHSL